MKIISSLVLDYPYVGMDTEFPGIVAKPVGLYRSTEALEYQAMRCNVDMLRIIQIGITLGNEKGELPKPCCTWQFNFKFDVDKDPYAKGSIKMLQDNGLDLQKFLEDGIDVYDFARLLIPSGLVLNDAITWVAFQCGADFGYLMKVLTSLPLPEDDQAFLEQLQIYFPHFYDIRYYTVNHTELQGGLERIIVELGVPRVGIAHQAGSDSLATLQTFFKLRESEYNIDAVGDVKNKIFSMSP